MKNPFLNIKKIFASLRSKRLLGRPLDDVLIKVSMAVLLIFVIGALLPSERPFEYSNLTVGSIAREEIIAPFTFPIIKTDAELKEERQQAWLSVPKVFKRESEPKDVQILKLKNLFEELTAYFKYLQKEVVVKKDTTHDLWTKVNIDSVLNQYQVKYGIDLTFEDFVHLYQMYKDGKLANFSKLLYSAFSKVYGMGIINISKSEIQEKSIDIMQNGLEENVDPKQVLDETQAQEMLFNSMVNQYPESSEEFKIAAILIPAFLKPDLLYDETLTNNRKNKAVREVPSTSGFVHENQRIVDNHEIITDDIYQKLQSLGAAEAERTAAQQGWHKVLFVLGKYIFALIIIALLGFYLYRYRLKIFNNNKKLLLITLIFLLQFFAAMLISNVLGWSYLSIPITLGPMLFSMLLDASFAFTATILISLVLGAVAGNNFYLALMTFIVGSVALYSVQKIRNRGQMFRAIFYIFCGYALINFSYGFVHYESFRSMLENLFFYMLPNAVLVPTAVFLLIGVFEKFFDVTTDITLLELSDLNHPLLKRLSVEAPGTFHHSIIVGNLAEAAAKEIGANSLLARVGCYYHDIGKMQRAEYFVENQAGAMNKHDSLTPTMSSLILSKHVRAGLELAEEYKLPLAVKQFIPEHHGTSVMAYFYHKAQETMDAKDINENDFRYPGPKPQSKETAIAMLADTVEAASRTLPNPNLQRISALVENLIEKRFQEGELDECDITLRELNKIKDAFIHILMGIHHLRIEYPGGEKQGEKPKTSKKIADDKDTNRNVIKEKAEPNKANSADLNKKPDDKQFETVHKQNNSGEDKKE